MSLLAKLSNRRLRAGILVVLCFVSATCSRKGTEKVESQLPIPIRHANPQFTAVPGTGTTVHEATLLIEALPTLRSTLRIRMITISAQEVEFPVTSEALFEVRSGELITLSNGQKTERHTGDMWLAPKGLPLRVRALNEFAVVRSIDLHPSK
jgi:hypothetical protein